MSGIRLLGPETWREFAQSFARQHHGWLVSIEQPQNPVSTFEPLRDVRLSSADGRSTVEVEVGAGDDLEVYRVEGVREVRVFSADSESAVERVEFGGDQGSLTLRFRTAIAPELVDGAPL